mmetsp:Transcript_106/g.391  ORF Transcript_106/g.391 Transcript_106/m.391 type:complete len:84 (-) Transcript_106:54-305(-)
MTLGPHEDLKQSGALGSLIHTRQWVVRGSISCQHCMDGMTSIRFSQRHLDPHVVFRDAIDLRHLRFQIWSCHFLILHSAAVAY